MNAQAPQQRSLFEYFDDEARTVMNAAREEVARTKRGALDAEHLFAAVVAGGFAGTAEVLAKAELDPQALRAALDEAAGTGDVEETPEQLPVGPGAQQALQVALQAAGQMLHGHVRPEHLVLGLIQAADGPVAKALEQVGSSRDALGRALMARLQSLPQNEEAKRRAEEARRQAQAQARSSGAASTAGMTDSAQRVLAEARRLAAELRHGQVGTVHLLLALLEDVDRMTHNVFFKVGVRGDDVRAELLRQLRADEGAAGAGADEAQTPGAES